MVGLERFDIAMCRAIPHEYGEIHPTLSEELSFVSYHKGKRAILRWQH